MKFSELKQKELEEKLLKIFTDCMLKYKDTQDEKYGEEWYFMEQVFNANLVAEPKQYFLLGQLAQKIHDIGPRAMKDTLKMMGIWKS